MTGGRDHGGGLDAAVARWGGVRADWLDLSTGINPVPYAVGDIGPMAWTTLPDQAAMDRLITAARTFWGVPAHAEIIAAPGASAIIARMPYLGERQGAVHIPTPTYNEHAAAFARSGNWTLGDETADTHVYVHPNNPDGRLWPVSVMGGRRLTVIDESFCDTMPGRSHVALSKDQGVIILKSFGKFWGLAGLRLGFAIGAAQTFAPVSRSRDGIGMASLADHLGPWAVAGPALEIGARAMTDIAWANATRARLVSDASRLDTMLTGAGAEVVGGTDLFRLYAVDDAAAWQDRLAQGRVLTRIFPYSRHWLRLGLPPPDRWSQLRAAM